MRLEKIMEIALTSFLVILDKEIVKNDKIRKINSNKFCLSINLENFYLLKIIISSLDLSKKMIR